MAEQKIPTEARWLLPSSNRERRLSLFWRMALVWVAATIVWFCIRLGVNAAFGSDYSRSSHIIRAVLTSWVIIPLILFARRCLDRRSWHGLTLSPLPMGWRPLLIGMICWLIPAFIGLALCLVLGWTSITPREPMGNILLVTLGLIFLVFIYEALPEELIFRGYFYRNLAAQFPRWLAVLIQAILFVLWGLANGGPISSDRSLLFFVAALILGVFRVMTGSVWASIGFHLAFQTVAQLFGSVGDQFDITHSSTLTLLAFGILPFVFSPILLKRFYTTPPNWWEREPDDL
ncbi:MAG: CPBP family intramembrane metalloprotease [Chloroflexi bacterium]|nr:CPBP family intramembrane metalloprotease [Chloroflexota bacterium]